MTPPACDLGLDETGEAIAIVLAFASRRDELPDDVIPLLDAAVVLGLRAVYAGR